MLCFNVISFFSINVLANYTTLFDFFRFSLMAKLKTTFWGAAIFGHL